MHRRRHDDSGIALFIAMLVIFVATVLALSAIGFAMHNLNTTSVDRNRNQSIAAAEAALDNTVYILQTSGGNLPCTIPSGTLSTTPAAAQYSVTISYYATNPPTGSPITCNSGSSLSSSTAVASAEIVAKAYTGSYSTEPRAMEALVTLTAQTGLTDAIYGNQIISFANNATVTRSSGSTAPNADLYTNGNYICQNNEWVDGSVYVQGYIQQSNTCGAAGQWDAKGSITAQGKVTVTGNVTSTTGNVSLQGNGSVGGSVFAGGSATVSSNMSISGTVNSNVAGLPAVPTQSFPQETFYPTDPSAWTSQGYNFIQNNVCSGTGSVYSTIASLSNTTSDTLVYTTCALSWTNNTSMTINHNLAIISTGGFSMSQKFTVDSTNLSVPHNFELIVPYNVYSSCSSTVGTITTSNQTAFGDGQTPSDIDTMLYTPCNITINNKQGLTGQIYGDGTVTINNNWSMTLQQMPLYGASNMTVLSYIAEYDYKREVSPT